MEEWIKITTPIIVKLCLIRRLQQDQQGQFYYQVVECFEGDWCDLVDELYREYGQFHKEVAHLTSHKQINDQLDKIAQKMKEPYSFMLPDNTDAPYIAESFEIKIKHDQEGNIIYG